MKNLYICLCACFIILSPEICAVEVRANESDSLKSFLDPNQMLKIWEDNYAHFESMKVFYTERVLEAVPPEKNPTRFDSLVRLMNVERIERGQRFWVRYSTAEEGFEKPDSIIGGSFDGRITREYTSMENRGMIIAGMIGRNTETMNMLKIYMRINRRILFKKNPSGPFETYIIEDPNAKPELSRILSRAIVFNRVNVLPKLEPVSGELCHVLEISYRGNINFKIWLAHGKGMLPLKFQRYENNKPMSDITVEQIGSVKNKGRIIWYPKKATRTSNRQDWGKIKHELTIHEFVPDIEVDDNMFRFVFPPGTRIHDEIRSMYYIAEDTLDSKTPASLTGKSLPDLNNLHLSTDPNQFKDKAVLICFWDMNQRFSRNYILQLNKKAPELSEKKVVVIAVQASKIEQAKLDEWIKENNITFPVGMIEGDSEKTRFAWGVKSLPWLILTNKEHIVRFEGFGIDELKEKYDKN